MACCFQLKNYSIWKKKIILNFTIVTHLKSWDTVVKVGQIVKVNVKNRKHMKDHFNLVYEQQVSMGFTNLQKLPKIVKQILNVSQHKTRMTLKIPLTVYNILKGFQ